MGGAKCIAHDYEEDVISARQSGPFNNARWQFHKVSEKNATAKK